MSVKRAGKDAAVNQLVDSRTLVSPCAHTRPTKGNIGRAEQLLLKAIAKDGQLAAACVVNTRLQPSPAVLSVSAQVLHSGRYIQR